MSNHKPYLVGIAGGSGSGKTTFIEELRKSLPEGSVALLSQDNYYHPKEKQPLDPNGSTNFDLPESIDREHFEKDVLKLMDGHTIVKKEYTFNNEKRQARSIEVQSAPIVVAEGLFVFHYDRMRSMLDLSVFIDAPSEIRLQRRINRDAEERGYGEETVKYQWDNHVSPAETRFLYPYLPEVDMIIDNTHSYKEHLAILTQRLLQILT